MQSENKRRAAAGTRQASSPGDQPTNKGEGQVGDEVGDDEEDYDSLHPGRRTALQLSQRAQNSKVLPAHRGQGGGPGQGGRFMVTVIDVGEGEAAAAAMECAVFIVPQVGFCGFSVGTHRVSCENPEYNHRSW